MAAAREELGGRLDIFINNAGQTMFRPATETTAEEYARLMATNLESCFHLAHPLLVAAASGGADASSVVNVSSVGGIISGQTSSAAAA